MKLKLCFDAASGTQSAGDSQTATSAPKYSGDVRSAELPLSMGILLFWETDIRAGNTPKKHECHWHDGQKDRAVFKKTV